MAAAGIDSRRQCEELILAGRVEVDRQVVRELGATVDPRSQEVRVDGEVLRLNTRREYFVINKPRGVLCTNSDPAGRTRVIDLLPQMRERLFTVGRLDLDSEGLILLTNDGELAHRLAHPRYGVQKVYHVHVAGVPTQDDVDMLMQGVRLAESWVRAERASIKSQHKQSATLEIVLREGKNREIRRLLARIGHKVMQLKRVSIGGVKLKDMEPGEWRRLSSDEVGWLHEAANGERREAFGDREGRPPRRADGRPPRRSDGPPPRRSDGPPPRRGDRPPRAEGRPPRFRSDEQGDRPARPPRDRDQRSSSEGRPPRRPPVPMNDGPPVIKGMMKDEPGTIKPLPRARKTGKRHKRRVLVGTTLRKKKR